MVLQLYVGKLHLQSDLIQCRDRRTQLARSLAQIAQIERIIV